MNEIKSKDVIVISIMLTLVIICGLLICFIVYYNLPEQRLKRHLSLGDKYLNELEYADALLEYRIAIAIDSKSTNAYIGAANAYIGLEEYDLAEEILYIGASSVEDDRDFMKKQELIYELISLRKDESTADRISNEEDSGREKQMQDLDNESRNSMGEEKNIAPSENESEKEWKVVYKEFIENREYLNSIESYDVGSDENDLDNKIAFALYDLDADGTPEIIANNGKNSYAEDMAYAYSCKDGKMFFLGELPGSYDDYRYVKGGNFPGLFIDGMHTGVYWTHYYYLSGDTIEREIIVEKEDLMSDYGSTGEIIEVERTSNELLFEANNRATNILTFVSESAYASLGWEGFLNEYGK